MKAIITDLDRTLLRTDKSISAYTLDVLARCRARGIRLMAASARPLRDVRRIGEKVCFDAVAASCGAVIALPEGREDIFIPRESAEKIIERLLAFPDVLLSAETSTGLYANADIPQWAPVVYDGFPRLPEGAMAYKILASSRSRALYEGVQEALTPDAYCTLAGTELLQIMYRRATKWNAVRRMLAHFGISVQDAVYFGDDNDDIEAIQGCGAGVAVKNAIPAVLAAADHVTGSNDEDGAAKWIAENIL